MSRSEAVRNKVIILGVITIWLAINKDVTSVRYQIWLSFYFQIRMPIDSLIWLCYFTGNTALTYLSLARNSLETVSQCMFDSTNHPTSLDEFYINANPLRCGQDLCWLKQVDTTWITVKNPSLTECPGPAALVGRKWDTLTEHDVCTTPVTTPCVVQGKCLN